MTAAQLSAFYDGTGQFFTALDSLLLVQVLGATAVFLWAAWIAVTAYKEWGSEEITQGDMIGMWFRAVFMMMILLFLFTV